MFFIYSIVSRIYISCIHLAAVFYAKASKAVQGRKNFFKGFAAAGNDPYIWFHCASLGEFEQGRPVIEKIKKDFPEKKILLSFFSPSGYEIKKDYEFADVVVYLPFDTPKNARKFLKLFSVEAAIFVKYDLWPFYLRECNRLGIPVFLMSATFRNDHFIFKGYGKFVKDLVMKMKQVFLQDKTSADIARRHGLTNISVSGDTRMDRVVQIRDENPGIPFAEKFSPGKTAVVWGSIWPADEPVIDSFLQQTRKEIKHIIAPHDISESYINHLEKKYPGSIRLSKYQPDVFQGNILVIDNVGMLNKLYKYASMAYVGGGFGKSIHNILEPAVYGIPVFFGPHFHKFHEATELIGLHLAYTGATPQLIAEKMKNYPGNILPPFGGEQKTNLWIKNNTGATSFVTNYLQDFL